MMSSNEHRTEGETAVSGQDLHEEVLMDLAQILAHRIRSLLASIEGFTDLLADSLGTREQRELALRIFEGTHRIERVLSDLQQYSHPVEPLVIPLSADDIIDDLLATLDPADRALISYVPEGERMTVLPGDPRLLRQALLVLLHNALDAVGRKDEVTVGLVRDEATQWVGFEVRNRGYIPLEDAPKRVFSPFFTTKAQNLGVGLSIARRIAEAHGGTLTLTENSPSTGTCFTLLLPGHGDEAAALLRP